MARPPARPETDASLRARLESSTGVEWLHTTARLMREARVWQFLTLQEVADQLTTLAQRSRRACSY